MPRIASFAPRDLIGYLGAQAVTISPEFRRWLDDLGRAISRADTANTGDIKATFSATVPLGWLRLDGSAVSKADYRELYGIFGGLHGETETTFNLPDLRGAFLRGVSDGLTARSGSNSRTLTAAQLPAHTHPVSDPGHGHAVADPGHAHTATAAPHTHDLTETTEVIPLRTATAVVAGGTDRIAVRETATQALDAVIEAAMVGVVVGAAKTRVSVASAETGIEVGSAGGGAAVDMTPLHLTCWYLVKT